MAQHLTFIFVDRWPTPESGIELKQATMPYREGKVFQFWLDVSKKLPLIVEQQERSRIPPHDSIKHPSFNFKKTESKKKSVCVMDAAIRFIKDEHKRVGGLFIVEELTDFFVVENLLDNRSPVLAVDKSTYEVRWIASASKR